MSGTNERDSQIRLNEAQALKKGSFWTKTDRREGMYMGGLSRRQRDGPYDGMERALMLIYPILRQRRG